MRIVRGFVAKLNRSFFRSVRLRIAVVFIFVLLLFNAGGGLEFFYIIFYRYLHMPYLQIWLEVSDFTYDYEPRPPSEIRQFYYTSDKKRKAPNFDRFDELVDRRCFAELPDQVDVEQFRNKSFDFFDGESMKHYKKILVWNYAFGPKHISFAFGHTPFERSCCRESRCFFTADASQVPVEAFDAIIFHFRSANLYRMPISNRNLNQRWIYYETESPANNYFDPDAFNGIFNWTMTYRRDSDVQALYGQVYRINTSSARPEGDFDARPEGGFDARSKTGSDEKTEMAAWLVSHCSTTSFREHYIHQLQNYIKVDIYGKCGDMSCPTSKKRECYKMIESKYKFYVAFENSLCRDYVTEKFFNILRYNIVPVVFGFADYESVSPPHSYINMLDFGSIKELADYLIYLDGNDTAYREYFSWKQSYAAVPNDFIVGAMNFCSLCQRLHLDTERKTYHQLRDWHTTRASCKRLRPFSWLENIFGASLFNGAQLPYFL